MEAYVCAIIPENFDVIASEKPDFDLEETRQWLRQHKEGYFLRDPSSVLDCLYFHPDVLFEMYAFYDENQDELFRKVVKI